jgi:signal transduction histidine kinase
MNNWLVPILLATPVLLLLALGIVAFVLRYQRRLLRQQEQIRQVREMAQQQALEAALLAQEDERRRIAADLHDGVGTTLAIVKLHLSTLGQPALTQEASALLDQAITEVRRISRNLLPAALQKFGLPFALDALARTVPSDGPTRLNLEQRGQPRRLNSHYELIVYRMVQELLGNGLRHAHSDRIDIIVDFGADTLSLHYTDNGIGFDTSIIDTQPLLGARTGHGLTNLQSRVKVLKGTLRYQSELGTGSQFWISLPVPYIAASQAPALLTSLL